MIVVLWGSSRQVDRFGEFYSYEGRCRGKILDPAGETVTTPTDITARGKRALSADEAARSSVRAAGAEAVEYLAGAIARRYGRAREALPLVVRGAGSASDVDGIVKHLALSDGVAEARCLARSTPADSARLLVRMRPGAMAGLSTYLQVMPGFRVEVTKATSRGPSPGDNE